jgi:hypothetical protein
VVAVDAYDTPSDRLMSQSTSVINVLKWIIAFAADPDAYATWDKSQPGAAKLPAMAEGENQYQASVFNTGAKYWSDYFADFQTTIPKLKALRYAMVWTPTWAPSPSDPASDQQDFAQAVNNPYIIMAGARNWYCPGFAQSC